MGQVLNDSLFKTIVANTPLISIDLIIQNSQEKILLGKRINRPAQGYWFVPGGRVRKNETLINTLNRLLKEELGISTSLPNTTFLGPFEHFYSDSFLEEDVKTHYIALGYKLNIDLDLPKLPNIQHDRYRWVSINDLLSADDVHLHTKYYFQDRK
ncbi:GDP-mannose mannosyl hydrolase [Photorhabdus bodei]|uniref:GDP-mannose mannosyl hydrolase n=1 Tax=Photorhabdus heterorhabditis TaxID=880156 RepID=A0A5B0X5Z4_9GAMM|nr:GDP-mannose mannosyl hydrolase [Photorhabdus heterorhabditis]KAA1194770.1 GDP-mannose mannosyl hydrolase [Photorhabdus heterorhabditis]